MVIALNMSSQSRGPIVAQHTIPNNRMINSATPTIYVYKKYAIPPTARLLTK